jgi:hypothetical protein
MNMPPYSDEARSSKTKRDDGNEPKAATEKFGGFELSPSVKYVLSQTGREKYVSAIDLFEAILNSHGEYGKGQGVEIRELLVACRDQDTTEKFSARSRTVPRWLKRVAALYVPGQQPVLTGRLVLLGLGMLDGPIADVVAPTNFFDKLVKELHPLKNLYQILSEQGRRSYPLLANYDDDDQLSNSEDNPLVEKNADLLDRAAFADFVAQLLNRTPLNNGAFSIHLHAPWGAGKTSFMNFMQESLKDTPAANGKPAWFIAHFNAWQNQGSPYPWWTFMNTIHYQLRGDLPWNYWVQRLLWNFRTKFQHLFVTLTLLGLAVYLLSKQFSAGSVTANAMVEVSKALGAIAGIWGITYAVSQGLNTGSKTATKSYLESRDNPINELKKRFAAMVKAARSTKLIIFIDDLDRCKSSFVVDFLESIQTIFKGEQIVFVIAADMAWLHACYEVEYDKIKSYIPVTGKSIGPLFIEKMFQLSVPLPGVPASIKEKCWQEMLQVKKQVPAIPTPLTDDGIPVTAAPLNNFEADHQQRIQSLRALSGRKSVLQTEHFLKPYGRFIELNPRNMKRLLNSYLVNKACSMISHIDIPKHQLALWTLLDIQWPQLTSWLVNNDESLDTTGNIINPPEELRRLLAKDDVRDVLQGKGFEAPLKVRTVQDAGVLFRYMNSAPENTAK